MPCENTIFRHIQTVQGYSSEWALRRTGPAVLRRACEFSRPESRAGRLNQAFYDPKFVHRSHHPDHRGHTKRCISTCKKVLTRPGRLSASKLQRRQPAKLLHRIGQTVSSHTHFTQLNNYSCRDGSISLIYCKKIPKQGAKLIASNLFAGVSRNSQN
jgi:hypothetical protein